MTPRLQGPLWSDILDTREGELPVGLRAARSLIKGRWVTVGRTWTTGDTHCSSSICHAHLHRAL